MILRSRRVVLPDGVHGADVHVENGRITRIDTGETVARLKPSRYENAVIDFGNLVISPGLVDTHVHVNEPGRTEWEGFDTATRAAAAGGVTTIVDMPLNSVPATTEAAALEAKRAAARGRVHVDVAFWGGVVPGNADQLEALVDAGVRGFKCFLAPSGVEEFRHVTERDLREALPILARRDVPLLVHAEDPSSLAAADAARPSYRSYLLSRPPAAERTAVDLMILLARESGARVHIVHVACAEAVEAIARAKADGVRITAETCPHYLTFTADEIGDQATEFKCAPPIREPAHRDALWDGLQAGVLDLVATDHSPAPPSMKCGGNFATAWGGIASLEMSLSAVFTGLDVERRLLPADGAADPAALRRIARWMSAAPAALARLDGRKGRIGEGYDADFVIWDPDAEWIVDRSRLQQRHKLTPYAGRTLRGVVRDTYVRGERVWSDGALTQSCAGTLL
ncbi:MAG TPA: allantoinase AllB [Vicinamibacterales bacterium]|nr:allantoinase AllB [Vicinamibacterales bacterium]